MIKGVVNARVEATIRLRVRAPHGPDLEVEALIDSGFTGSLALPSSAIATLGLAHQSGGRAILADGSVQRLDIYAAEVEWHGNWRALMVAAVGDEALIGMQLLAGNELRIVAVPDGVVEIIPHTLDINEPVLSFTPDEQRVLALYRDPRHAGLRRATRLSLQYAAAAGCFVAVAIVTGNALWSLAVFGVFVLWMGIRLLSAKKIAGAMPRIIQKYEDYVAQFQASRNGNPTGP